ncbi:NAD(P)-binding protein [Xylariaceae sp. AK1471]|nr:NAD(P)-binding protein [Xylariaceae sp. AK1471]
MPVALIIGVGAGIGQASATAFAAAGYNVAIASRTQKLDSTKFPFFEFDASEPTEVPALFEKVHKEVGVPSIVVYNAYASAGTNRSPSPFDIDTVEAFQKRMNVNAVSPAVAAHEAAKGFLELDSQGKLGPGGGTYIFVGNALNEKALKGFFTLGIGKSASAYLIENLALTAYEDKPFSFYYVDERHADGSPMYKGVNSDAHAEVFLQLAQDAKQGPWQYTFAKGTGYARFSQDWALE